MKQLRNLSGLLVLALMWGTASASSIHVYDFTFDGTTITTNVSATGEALAVGDTLDVTWHAAGTGAWSAGAGAFIWPPIEVLGSGVRVGNWSWSLLLGATAQQSAAVYNDSSCCVHLFNYIVTAAPVVFDKVMLSYTLLSSNADSDILSGPFSQIQGAAYTPGAAAVAEPPMLALLALGLLGVGAVTRRRSA